METTTTFTPDFIEKINAVISAITAPKAEYNSFGNFSYRTVDSVLIPAKKAAIQNGLLLTITTEMVEIGGKNYCTATATLTDGTHTLTAQGQAREADAKKGMDDSQITGCASTYAIKRALGNLLLVDSHDTDPDSLDNRPAQTAPVTTQPVYQPYQQPQYQAPAQPQYTAPQYQQPAYTPAQPVARKRKEIV